MKITSLTVSRPPVSSQSKIPHARFSATHHKTRPVLNTALSLLAAAGTLASTPALANARPLVMTLEDLNKIDAYCAKEENHKNLGGSASACKQIWYGANGYNPEASQPSPVSSNPSPGVANPSGDKPSAQALELKEDSWFPSLIVSLGLGTECGLIGYALGRLWRRRTP